MQCIGLIRYPLGPDVASQLGLPAIGLSKTYPRDLRTDKSGTGGTTVLYLLNPIVKEPAQGAGAPCQSGRSPRLNTNIA